MLLRNKDEQEVVSREKKDRRDFEQLSALATRMGLYRYLNLIIAYNFPRILFIKILKKKKNLLWQPTICKSCCL